MLTQIRKYPSRAGYGVNKTIVFAGDAPSSTLLDRERRGELRRLATGVYTTDVTAVPADVVRREWHTIVGHLYAGAVITDRSGVTGGPVDGYLYLAHSARPRETELPGLIVIARPGAGPLAGDISLPGRLYQASKGRTLVENTRPSRARNGRPRRTLDADELADWIDRLAMVDDDDKLAAYRIAAERTAQPLGAADDAIATVSRLIGAALGSRSRRVDVDELFRGVPPIKSIEDLAAPDVFETDEELDEFLAFVRADRNANLA